MINLIKDGDMFTVPADILINPVNRYGISGAGLAKEFKKRYPDHDYVWRKAVTFPMNYGKIGFVGSGIQVCYFPTKHHHSNKYSDVALIKHGLNALKEHLVVSYCWKNVVTNMPALGCGLGGLDFEGWLKPLVYEMFENEPYTINLFEPK